MIIAHATNTHVCPDPQMQEAFTAAILSSLYGSLLLNSLAILSRPPHPGPRTVVDGSSPYLAILTCFLIASALRKFFGSMSENRNTG